MELDTGAAMSLISKKLFTALHEDKEKPNLQPATVHELEVVLRTWH